MEKIRLLVLFLLITCEITAYAQNCGSSFGETTGEVLSPGFPGNYPANLNCSWTIEAAQNLDVVIELTIQQFEVEYSELCLNDSLMVYDGASTNSPMLVSPSCGTKISWPAHPSTVRSTGRAMTIVFTTNDVISAGGFRATFKQVMPREDFFVVVDVSYRKIYRQERSSVKAEALPVFGLLIPVAVDFDPIERKVYFTDVGSKFIGRIGIDGSNQETLATSHIGVPDGIAVDYVTRNMYWTDTGTDTISVARLDGTYRRILVDENIHEPRDIIVEPNEGYIYWSDWGSFPKIEKSFGDGSNRIVIASLFLGWPNGITLDETAKKLYWADAKLNRIERCNLDGSHRELLKAFVTDVHPFGLVVAEDGIYWTDWVTQGIDVADRNFQKDTTTLNVNGVPTRLHGLAYHSSVAALKPTTDCSLGWLNSGCEELCVLIPSGMECLAVSPIFDMCPEDIYISIKETTVVEWRKPSVSSPSAVDVEVTSSHGSSNSTIVTPSSSNITVTYQALDIFGNSAHCSFSISVTYDNQAPRVIKCPDDITKELPPSQENVIVVWEEPEVVDNSGDVSLIQQSNQSGSKFGLGETDVVYIWQDEAKNTAECKFQIQIIEGSEGTVKTTISSTVKTTIRSTEMAKPEGKVSPILIVILFSAVAILLLAIVIGVIIGKCVKCQCKFGSNNRSSDPNAYMTSMQMNQGINCISGSQLLRPPPPPDHPLAPNFYEHCIGGSHSIPTTNVNSVYCEVTEDPPAYSCALPRETLSDVKPPLPTNKNSNV
ncbi:Low-density lipoprotein receptor-related protein 6 [Holothuria leucospilota]|uniref:Low-density lipoprotein receptor-related protein 6 n=1 Tax=Holothuria leucospilota TaxID=206669 RepID=A0A9Q1CCG3_HOLLE|nr:Low-density lipoprotein receptor-related protein 6 [Holothuria leucospilota]